MVRPNGCSTYYFWENIRVVLCCYILQIRKQHEMLSWIIATLKIQSMNNDISNNLADIPNLKVRTVSIFKRGGDNFSLKIADAGQVKGEGIRVNLGEQTLKALLRNPVTVRLNNVKGAIGTKKDDRMIGSSAGEVFVGKGGKDQIKAGGGADFLIGSGQGDALFGGAGNDFLFGDGLSDYAKNGLDLGGTTFNAGLFGFSQGGKDRLIGGAGADVIIGGGLADTLKGGAGFDRLIGETGNDEINGGKNRDIIVGGQGADTLTGGEGVDSFVYVNPKEGGDRIKDFTPGEDRFFVYGSNFKGQLFDSGDPNFFLTSRAQSITREQFRIGASARSRSDRFIYNRGNGTLSYDQDGSGNRDAQVIAKLVGKPELSFSDIFSI